MKERLLRFLEVEPEEAGRVSLLFLMGIFMGVFIATFSVASQSLLLSVASFSEQYDLPYTLLISGLFGLVVTSLYNFLQNRIPFQLLGSLSIILIVAMNAFVEFGQSFFASKLDLYKFSFAMNIPFAFLVSLVFWGSFGRLFNLRQAKRLVGTVDLGAMLATFIAFFSIPFVMDQFHVETETLYTISLVSIISFLSLFGILGITYVRKAMSFEQERKMFKKLEVADFIKNRYIRYMSLFIIFSMVAINFIDFSFLNATTAFFKGDDLPSFISFFESAIVIVTFLIDVFATDRFTHQYGMRVTLLVNPLLIGALTVAALLVGLTLGYEAGDNMFVIYFLTIAMSKLFIRSLREGMDNPTFKMYLLPIQSRIRIDVQTKIEGVVTAVANVVAAGLIILISQSNLTGLIYITVFTIPAFVIWYLATNRMHKSYRQTLQQALTETRENAAAEGMTEYTVNSLLEKEVSSTAEDKVIYGLKLMEKLEPTLFENSVISLTSSENKRIRKFTEEKMREMGIEKEQSGSDFSSLAKEAALQLEDSDLLSISVDNLMKLSKSIKQNDRVLAAKLLRKQLSHRTIFILLELLRDVDPKVRMEALLTARKVKRQETWPILIEMLSSPSFGHHAAAALKDTGEIVLPTLEGAFHKSGQTDLVMLRLVQIMGRIGGPQALELLWKKADFPDKRIVKQILYSLRYVNYQAKGREAREVLSLLDTEISKTMWNLAALSELPETKEFYFLREALQDEVSENYGHIAILLSIIYDPKAVHLVMENLATGDPDNITFAMELLDLFVDQELKPKLFPLIDDTPTSEKLNVLQTHFPRETYTPIQVINYILNRDFNLNNRWTKACAIHMSAYIPDFRISRGLAAQVFNHDRLLQETAAWVIYNKDRKAYDGIRDRIPMRDKKFLDNSIEKNQLLDGLDDGFFLGIEIVMFLKTVHVFRNIHGSILCDLADKVQPIDLQKNEVIKFKTDVHNAPIFIIAHGGVHLRNGDQIITSFQKGDVYGDLFQDGAPVTADNLIATDRTVVFKIDIMDFYFVMANHHELVQGLIKNITENREVTDVNSNQPTYGI